MKRQCKNCQSWLLTDESNDFANCGRIKTDTDVRTTSRKLQTSHMFCCKYFKKKEVENAGDSFADRARD
jgi:hypothetical protein